MHEGKFYLSTRVNQFILNGLSKDCETCYNVITNFGDDGYDYYIAAKLDDPVYNQSRYIELWLPIMKNKSPHH